MTALRETLRRGSATGAGTYRTAARSLQRSVASAMQRSQQQLDRSRELCRVSEVRLKECDAILQASQERRSAKSDTGRALWHGN